MSSAAAAAGGRGKRPFFMCAMSAKSALPLSPSPPLPLLALGIISPRNNLLRGGERGEGGGGLSIILQRLPSLKAAPPRCSSLGTFLFSFRDCNISKNKPRNYYYRLVVRIEKRVLQNETSSANVSRRIKGPRARSEGMGGMSSEGSSATPLPWACVQTAWGGGPVGVVRVIGLLCVNMSVKEGKRKERERERKVGKGLADISKAAAAAAAAAPRAAIRADIDRRNNNGGANAMLAVN